MCVCASVIDCVTYLRKFTPLLPWLVTSARSTLLYSTTSSVCVCACVGRAWRPVIQRSSEGNRRRTLLSEGAAYWPTPRYPRTPTRFDPPPMTRTRILPAKPLRNLLWVPNLSQLTRMAPSYLGLFSFH